MEWRVVEVGVGGRGSCGEGGSGSGSAVDVALGDEVEEGEGLAGEGVDALETRRKVKALALRGALGEEEVAREVGGRLGSRERASREER